MGFQVPWVVSGAKHSARLFRRTYQQQVGAGSGVSRPGDLKVQALSVPGTGVRIAPGGASIQSRDTAASARESYGPILDAELVVPSVPGTGSGSGRRDLVVLEITDPEMLSVTYPAPVDEAGWQDGSNFCRITVIPGVASDAKSLSDVTDPAYANVTGLVLAAINWPASTATITNAMIEDLRRVHSPRSLRVLRTVDLTVAQSLSSTTAAPDGAVFPTEFSGSVGVFDIPEWATHARIQMTWSAINMPGVTERQVHFWVQISANANPNKVVTPQGISNGDGGRENWVRAATVAIPAGLRGIRTGILPKARLAWSLSPEFRPVADNASAMVLDVEFFEDTV